VKIEGIGIDFGTYNTKIAVFAQGRPFILQKPLKKLGISGADGVIPSFLVKNYKEIIIGKLAKKFWEKGKDNVYFRFKLGIGKDKLSEDVSLLFFKSLKIYLQKIFPDIDNIPITFTHPNNWDSLRIEKFSDILREAGFNIQDNYKYLCREPYAAGNYILSIKTLGDGYYLVIDVGAGTFDASILYVEGDKLEVKKEFDSCLELAGSHIDEMIASYILGKQVSYKEVSHRNFLSQIERAKIEVNRAILSKDENFKYPIHYQDKIFYINKKIIEEACKDFSRNIEILLKNLKNNLKLNKIDLKGIILAGGSGKFFLIIETIKNLFRNLPILNYGSSFRNTDDSIPLGAALEASGKRVVREIVKYPLVMSIRKGIFFGDLFLKDLKDRILEYGEKLFIEVFPKGIPLPAKEKTENIFKSLQDLYSLSFNSYPKVEFYLLKHSIKEIKEKKLKLTNEIIWKAVWSADKYPEDLAKLKELDSNLISFDIIEDENKILYIVLKGFSKKQNRWIKINQYRVGDLVTN